MDLEPYRLWWRCLRLSDPSNWEPRVVNRLEGAHTLSFEQWWAACSEWFEEPRRFLVDPITSPADVDEWRGDDVAVFLVHLLEPKDKLIDAFRARLDEVHQGKPGRPAFDNIAEFPLKYRPNVGAIKTALDVWERLRSHPAEKNWQVAVALRINPSRSKPDPNRGDGKPATDDRKVLNAEVSRYNRRAETLIRGVERGIFPAKERDL